MSSWTGCTSTSDANACNRCTNMSFETALGEADLSYADLLSTSLFGAKLYGAELTGADLRNANLWDTDLSSSLVRARVAYGRTAATDQSSRSELPTRSARAAHVLRSDRGTVLVKLGGDRRQDGHPR